MDTDTRQSIGIIGGGKVGLQLMLLFHQSDLTRVAYVLDTNRDAPALEQARMEGIHTFTDLDEALKVPTDFVLEVTGSDKVVQLLQQKITHSANRLITHEMAYIILQVIEEKNDRTKKSVVQEIGGIKSEIDQSLNMIDNLVDSIGSITSEMRILALNARIEAARVGDQGKGFGVVAQEMAGSVNEVRKIATEIENMDNTIQATANKINASLKKLE
jgi:hypothetical protein